MDVNWLLAGVLFVSASLLGYVLTSFARTQAALFHALSETQKRSEAQINSLLHRLGAPIAHYAPPPPREPTPSDGLDRFYDPDTGVLMVEVTEN